MAAAILRFMRNATLVLLVGGLTACGSSSSSLCDRAAECDYIGEDDVEECTSDIDKAVEKGDLTSEDVSGCLDCASENSCGGDIILDCGEECGAVSGYIAGSQLH